MARETPVAETPDEDGEKPSLEARLDARLKAMFQAIQKEKRPTRLPDLDGLPRPRRDESGQA